MPQGPDQAVRSQLAVAIQGPLPAGGVGRAESCGWPESSRLSSNSHPFGVIFLGVWQSPQPMVLTR